MSTEPSDPILTPPVGSAAVSSQSMAPASDATAPSSPFPIVGVGASAGGLKAMASLLADVPSDTGMAFVLIQHLDPTHESLLSTLLARSTRLPITQATDGVEVRPNHVYVIAPNTSLALDHGTLRVTSRDSLPRPHFSIDFFFQSLARDRTGRAIGVLLSGTGTDGTLGLAAIKAAGGVTFAHDHTAEHGSMPFNAINHDCVDHILSPDKIAQEIAKIARHGFSVVRASIPLPPLQIENDDQDARDDVGVLADDDAQITAIIKLVRTRLGIDFTQYRPTTIRRRIIRRLGILLLATIGDYVRFLAAHPEEASALVKDLLINVTSFYRDPKAFNALTTTVFPVLMRNRQATDTIRIWVTGCSTGQEVYSLAIELMEYLKDSPSIPGIQIFASDISDWALAKARVGSYPESIVADAPPDRLARYFTKDHQGYTISKTVRDLCIFIKHDVTADTPFSKIDLISCRNLLIYLTPMLQMRVFQTFQFAMKPGGMLLLGSAEAVGQSSDLFGPVDENNRIFQKKLTARRIRPVILATKHKNVQDMPNPASPSVPSVTDMHRVADRVALERFVPAGVLVNDSLDIIQFRGRTHPFLEPAQGEVSLNLLTMVPFGVADSLKTTIDEARQQNVPVRREHVPLRRGEHFREIAFEVIPIVLPALSPGCFLILFEEQDRSVPTSVPPQSGASAHEAELSAEAREVLQLRKELTAATNHIQSITEKCSVLDEQLKMPPKNPPPPLRSFTVRTWNCKPRRRSWTPPTRSWSPSTRNCATAITRSQR